MSNAVIIGASSGVGRALARELGREGYDLLLVSRDLRDIGATASDITERFGVKCVGIPVDISLAELDVEELVQRCAALLGGIERVFIPAGAVSENDVGANPEVLIPLTHTNYLGPARLASAFARLMISSGTGEIVLFSSIAAGAPRTNNVAYSASKAALEVYAHGLRHYAEPRGLKVSVYALGYVDTVLSFGRTLRLPSADPNDVARYVVRRAGRPGRHFYPRFWGLVVFVLRALPWTLYRRLSF